MSLSHTHNQLKFSYSPPSFLSITYIFSITINRIIEYFKVRIVIQIVEKKCVGYDGKMDSVVKQIY